MTRTHTLLRQGGRQRFLAPELSAGPEQFRINEASDIYSLAMTIYALGTGLVPFHDLKGDFAASRSAEEGIRPSSFRNSMSPDVRPNSEALSDHNRATISLGGLTQKDSELVWKLMIQMWDNDPLMRPSVSVVRREMALNGLISPLPRSPTPTDYSVPGSPVPQTGLINGDAFADLEPHQVRPELKKEGSDWWVLFNARVPRALDIGLNLTLRLAR